MKKLLRSEKFLPVIVIVVLALVIALNAAIGGRQATHVDLTESKVTMPVQQARDILKGVNTPVRVYVLQTESTRNVWLDELTARMAAENKLITVSYVDPSSTQMETISRYANGQTLADGSILVVSDKRSAVLTATDLFSYEIDQAAYYYTGVMSYTSAEFTVQDAVCRAITYVTRDDMPVLYVLSGHGESGWDSELYTLCFHNSIEPKTLTLASGASVPEDAAALLLCGPAQPYEEATVDALLDYLKNGGDMLLMTNFNTDFTSLDRLTEYYGMARKAGLVIDGDTSHVYSADYKYYLRPDMRDNAVTAPLIEAKQKVIMPVCEAIVRSDVRRAGLNAQPLLMTTNQAYIKLNTEAVATLDMEEGDEPGQFILGMAAVEGDTHLTWLTSTSALASGVNSVTSGGNDALFASALRQMFEFPVKAEAVPGSNLLAAPASIPMVPALIALIGLPLICLIIGLIRRRKH